MSLFQDILLESIFHRNVTFEQNFPADVDKFLKKDAQKLLGNVESMLPVGGAVLLVGVRKFPKTLVS